MSRPHLHELFSRGASPPQLGLQQPFSPKSTSSPNQLDSLFHNMNAPSSSQQISGAASANMYAKPALPPPNKSPNEDAISSGSAPANSTADRQSALLSLLGSAVPTSGGSVRGATSGGQQPQPQPPSQPQQVPTPPGSSQRAGN